MKYRIGHLAYSVKDMAASLDFYVNKLEFRHSFSIHNDKDEPWIEYLMSADGRFVELFHPGDGPVPADGGSYLHLCLEVDDLAQAVAELEEKGVEIRVRPNQGKDHNMQAWIRDPDGRDIELMQMSPVSPQCRAREQE